MASSARNRVLMALGAVAVALVGSVIGYTVAGDDDDEPTKLDASGTDSGSTTDDGGASDEGSEDDGGADDGASDEGPSEVPPPVPVSTDGLTGPALDLANAINNASSLTYHAVYQGSHEDVNGAPTEITVEVWRGLPLARRDTRVKAGDGTLQTRELRLADGLFGCVDTQKGDTEPEWICLPDAGQGTDAAEPVLGRARPVEGTVTVADDTVGGVPSRCYTVTGVSKVEEVCFDADGIPTSIDGGDGAIVRTQVGRGIDPDDIVIPEGAEMRQHDSVVEPA
jgi:hypothetical protein